MISTESKGAAPADAETHEQLNVHTRQIKWLTSEIDRHEQQLSRLGDAVSSLRHLLSVVATKQDITDLRNDLLQLPLMEKRVGRAMIPIKVAAWFAGAVALVAILALAVVTLRGA